MILLAVLSLIVSVLTAAVGTKDSIDPVKGHLTAGRARLIDDDGYL